jgi:hypothetical protein
MQRHRNDSKAQPTAATTPAYSQHTQHAYVREAKPRYTIFRGEIVSLDRLADLREAD